MFRKLVKALIPRSLFRRIEPYGHLVEAIIINISLGFPARGLKVIGVTGTDGKTTTSFYIYRMLREAGFKVGLQTTVAYGVDRLVPNPTHMTVVNSRQLLQRIKAMRAEGMEWLVMETTSHSLAQNRDWGIPYSLGVWTNLTHEHADYHGSMERYREAKLRLFQKVAANRSGLRTAVVNADDPNVAWFAATTPKVIRYGTKHGDMRAREIVSTAKGSSYQLTYQRQTLAIKTALPGQFNVYNSLAAAGVGFALGLTPTQIEQGIAALEGVAGRMSRVEVGQKFAVIVDFAHTPNAMVNVFTAMRAVTKGRMIVVFGATGNRDKTKRPAMGQAAGQYCDLVVLTEDDDGTEDGQAILETLAKGAEAKGKRRDHDLLLIHDRREAIRRAIQAAGPNDAVMLLGIGHQTTLNTSQGEIPWSERGEAEAAIAAKSSRS